MESVRTRFAPSPTGFLHIGGLRTALYEYLYAKSLGGTFVLRVEDTDKRRFVPGSIESLCRVLKTFNLIWDEGPEVGGPYAPYIQSERVASGVYKTSAEKLVNQGNAYYCFCPAQTNEEIQESHANKELILRDPCRSLTKEEVAQHTQNGETPAIRLRIPDGEVVSYHDFVLDKDISWNTNFVDEVMLLKSDGYPTYQLAVVVDDVAMKISHIIRAHEWLPSTPVHLLLFRYLNFPQPKIGHVTDILDPDGGKLSKRKRTVSCEDFISQGYLPEAILNFILLCGWAPKDNREIYSLSEMTQNFQNGSLQIANAVFNQKKLDWFNGHYIRQKSDTELSRLLVQFAPPNVRVSEIEKITPLVKERITKLSDFTSLAGFFWVRPSLSSELFSDPDSRHHLQEASQLLSKLSAWNVTKINNALQSLPEKYRWKTGDFFMSLRLSITGSRVTPPLSESLVILGKDETLARLSSALSLFN